MTPEKQRIAIAEACGLDVSRSPNPDPADRWKTCYFTPEAAKQRRASWPSSAVVKVIPDYLSDLNAMHEAEQLLTDNQCQQHFDNLAKATNAELETLGTVYGVMHFRMYNATAAQRAEAFLRTLSLWIE